VVPFRLECSACGAGGEASCTCGAPYLPAGQRAVEAVKANPEKSNRAIAGELGVSKDTVRRARTGASAPVDKRVGLDGKTRRLPTRQEPEYEPGENEFDGDPARHLADTRSDLHMFEGLIWRSLEMSRPSRGNDPRACTLSDAELDALADRLFAQGTGELLANQPKLQGDLRLAAKAIKALQRRLRV
jgi:hypothetical protein